LRSEVEMMEVAKQKLSVPCIESRIETDSIMAKKETSVVWRLESR